MSARCATASSYAASVFSGRSPDAPRCAITSGRAGRCAFNPPSPATVRTAPLPARVERVASVGAHARLEQRDRSSAAGKRRFVLPEPDRESGERRGAERRHLEQRRPLDHRAEDVGLELHQEVVGRRTAVDAQRVQLDPGVGLHAVDDVARLIGDRLERRAHDVLARGAARDADQEAARLLVPVGCAEPGERRHEIDARRILDGRSERLALRRGCDQAEAVTQPLDGRARDEDAAFERVFYATTDPHAIVVSRTRLRARRHLTRVHQQEAAGAVGVLRAARAIAALPEQRRLLIAGDSRDRHTSAPNHSGSAAPNTPHESRTSGSSARGTSSSLQHPVVPSPLVHVVEQRARRIRVLGGVNAALREPIQEPRVDGAERQLAALCALARSRHGVEDEADLRAREVGVDHQAGARAHLFGEPARAQLLADRRRLARLPHDRAVDRLAGSAVPHHGRLTLVRDPDRGDVGSARARLRERILRRAQLGAPDLLRIVLDPARLREVLRELDLIDRCDRAVAVEEDRSATRWCPGPGPSRICSSAPGARARITRTRIDVEVPIGVYLPGAWRATMNPNGSASRNSTPIRK